VDAAKASRGTQPQRPAAPSIVPEWTQRDTEPNDINDREPFSSSRLHYVMEWCVSDSEFLSLSHRSRLFASLRESPHILIMPKKNRKTAAMSSGEGTVGRSTYVMVMRV